MDTSGRPSPLDSFKRIVSNADTRDAITALRKEVQALRREMHDRLLQYHLQLGRLARGNGGRRAARAAELSRAVPAQLSPLAGAPHWDVIDASAPAPDPEGREWMVLDACAVCGGRERTVAIEWNKLLLMDRAPDAGAARYDYSLCHACGVLYASRRPIGERYRYLLAHFGEVVRKRNGAAETGSPLLNPHPLDDDDRATLRRLISHGVFVSDHLELKGSEYLRGLLADRFGMAAHLDIIGSLVPPHGGRVLEIRSKTGTILDGLRRLFGARVYAMPIWESQRFVLEEAYGIETSPCIDFDRFQIPFAAPFELIVCNHMLTHIIRPREFFATLHDHLAPGGHLYLHSEPDDREFLNGAQSAIAHLNPLHMQAFDQRSLMRGLAANGFEVVFLKSQNLEHICLARKAEARCVSMGKAERQKRVAAYQRARDHAVLALPERYRNRVADRWTQTVERAVASGEADFDESGQLRLVSRRPSRRASDVSDEV